MFSLCYLKKIDRSYRKFQVVTVLPPGVIWRMPLCGVYPLGSIKSGVLDITIGMIKKVIHSNGESPSFCNMM